MTSRLHQQNTFNPYNLIATHLSFNVLAIYLAIYYINQMEKEMATHCSILAWRTPWTEEPGELQSMGLQRVGHD